MIVIWLGEKTLKVRGIARIIRVETDNIKLQRLQRIRYIAKYEFDYTREPTFFELETMRNNLVIVRGGVNHYEDDVIYGWLEGTLSVERSEEEDLRRFFEPYDVRIIIPSGVGSKTYAVILRKVKEEDERWIFEEVHGDKYDGMPIENFILTYHKDEYKYYLEPQTK